MKVLTHTPAANRSRRLTRIEGKVTLAISSSCSGNTFRFIGNAPSTTQKAAMVSSAVDDGAFPSGPPRLQIRSSQTSGLKSGECQRSLGIGRLHIVVAVYREAGRTLGTEPFAIACKVAACL